MRYKDYYPNESKSVRLPVLYSLDEIETESQEGLLFLKDHLHS